MTAPVSGLTGIGGAPVVVAAAAVVGAAVVAVVVAGGFFVVGGAVVGACVVLGVEGGAAARPGPLVPHAVAEIDTATRATTDNLILVMVEEFEV
jgi:hypothetical protein